MSIICILYIGGCIKSPTESKSAPVAAFSVEPKLGNFATDFLFDAHNCADAQNKNKFLKVRWDWENDEIWDTEYSTTKIITHRFTAEGRKVIKLEVLDTSGLSDYSWNHVTVRAGSGEFGKISDIDGNIYQTIKIGDQWWMSENLKATHYLNGDVIQNVTGDLWQQLASGAYTYNWRDNNYVSKYGYLYNWYAINDLCKLAPQGWHIPSNSEWQILIDYLGGSDVAGRKLKEIGTLHWAPNNDATNESGFYALPAGYRDGASQYASGQGGRASFWSCTEQEPFAWGLYIQNDYSFVINQLFSKRSGFSVRCVKD